MGVSSGATCLPWRGGSSILRWATAPRYWPSARPVCLIPSMDGPDRPRLVAGPATRSMAKWVTLGITILRPRRITGG